MSNSQDIKHLSIQIKRAWDDVYEFLSIPTNFPKWASGLGEISKSDNHWIAKTPDGEMEVSFSEVNKYGVLDHWVYPNDETEIYIPMRLIEKDRGNELIFTLIRQPGMSDEKFAGDATWVMKDLNALKNLLESTSA